MCWVRVMDPSDLSFELRPASREDFDFAWLLYRDLMKPLADELLVWNEEKQKAVVQEALAHDGTSIIVVNGSNAGWLHVIETPSAIYLCQLYVQPALQNHGIGTAIVGQLCDKARNEDKAFGLEVLKNNRALSLYERLGFRVVGLSEHKLEMRWQEEA